MLNDDDPKRLISPPLHILKKLSNASIQQPSFAQTEEVNKSNQNLMNMLQQTLQSLSKIEKRFETVTSDVNDIKGK